MDGHNEAGGVLRFIKNALNCELQNCKFIFPNKTFKVQTTKKIHAGCELFIAYGYKEKYTYDNYLTEEVKDAVFNELR